MWGYVETVLQFCENDVKVVRKIIADIKKIWEQLPKEEKEKFDYQIIKFQEKYIRFCIIDKYINL